MLYSISTTLTDLQADEVLSEKAKEQSNVSGNGTFNLGDFTYNTSAVADTIFQHLQESNFMGITVISHLISIIIIAGMSL